MKLWRAPTGDLVVDVDCLIGLKITTTGQGSTKKWTLSGIADARDVDLLTGDEATVRKAYGAIVDWVAPPIAKVG